MKVPEEFELVSNSFTEDGDEESLQWIEPDTDITIYPEFFKTELLQQQMGVKHFVTDNR
jgi:hypothetical protein